MAEHCKDTLTSQQYNTEYCKENIKQKGYPIIKPPLRYRIGLTKVEDLRGEKTTKQNIVEIIVSLLAFLTLTLQQDEWHFNVITSAKQYYKS